MAKTNANANDQNTPLLHSFINNRNKNEPLIHAKYATIAYIGKFGIDIAIRKLKTIKLMTNKIFPTFAFSIIPLNLSVYVLVIFTY